MARTSSKNALNDSLIDQLQTLFKRVSAGCTRHKRSFEEILVVGILRLNEAQILGISISTLGENLDTNDAC